MDRASTTSRARLIVGWVVVGIATLVTSFLGFWGILENFHEGWHHPTLLLRLIWTTAYLSLMMIVMALSLVSVRWPWVGSTLHFSVAAFAWWFFQASLAVAQMIVLPVVVLGLGYVYGRPEPRKWAYWLLIALPLAVVVVCGIEPVWRVATRIDDGDRGARHLQENGVNLIWAPQGPGWPTQGLSWHDAMVRCRHLTADGLGVADMPQDIWRLPTVEEAVRSQCRHGRNCKGTWDAATGTASYDRRPDKESPLWDPYSQVTYWWTATEINDQQAYMIVYDGKVWPRNKSIAPGYLGFRAVKSADTDP
jgi:hypothetical protein